MKLNQKQAIKKLKEYGWIKNGQRWIAPSTNKYPKLFKSHGLSLREACSIEGIVTDLLNIATEEVKVNKSKQIKQIAQANTKAKPKQAEPEFILNPTIVQIIESESGWGQKVDEVRAYPSKAKAEAFVEEFNKSNTDKTVPNWYMVARIVSYGG